MNQGKGAVEDTRATATKCITTDLTHHPGLRLHLPDRSLSKASPGPAGKEELAKSGD